MTAAQELQKCLHARMPLFITLGDEIHLSIIEILTKEALDRRQTPGPTHFEQYGFNVNEIARRTNLPRPAISHYLKILKGAGIVGVCQENTADCYYFTLREFNRRLTELGYRLEESLYWQSVLKSNSAGPHA